MMKWLELTAVCLAAVMSWLFVRIFRQTGERRQWLNHIRDEITGHDYGKLESRLLKSGMAEKITPSAYRLLQGTIFLCVFAVFLLAGSSFPKSVGMGLVLMFLPELVIKGMVRRENRKMLSDIEHIFNLLHLQNQAGTFFLDSLVDSYYVVTYWRLKKAMIVLTGEINGNRPVKEATRDFAAKFDNPYITALADIICHGIEDGSTQDMLGDVADQIRAIQQAQYVAAEGKQEAENILVMTLLFIGIVAGMVYLSAGVLSNNISDIWM